MKYFTNLAFIIVTVFSLQPAFAANSSVDNMEILRDKIKADKKLVVAANMQLTESEAKGFWPVYQAYQKDLEALNERTAAIVASYADAWNSKSVDNEKAKKLTDDFLVLLADEASLMKSYAPKLEEVLPPIKVARYLQIENKIRAILKYELAAKVPLIPGN